VTLSWVPFVLVCPSLAQQTKGTAHSKAKPLPARTAPYDALTNPRAEVVNFLPEPGSGLAFDSAGRLYAVNPYASTVVRYSAITEAPELTLLTGLNPVSVAVYEPNGSIEGGTVLVLCAGTHALFAHDPVSGRVLDVVQLESEPLDLVVDRANARAFVSCQGTNAVLAVGLPELAVEQRYVIPCGQRPGPLYLDAGVLDVPGDERVYVAATQTGNNSIATGPGGGAAGSVFDLDGNPGGELADHDVFCIDPGAKTITPVVRGAGSLIFDLERNVSTPESELWVLSTDSNNKDAAIDTEAKLRGRIAVNQLAAIPGVTGDTLVQATDGIDLDDTDSGANGPQYLAARSLNQARSLAILGPTSLAPGWAFVASPMSDVIGIFDPQRDRFGTDLVLPPRAQCYDLELSPLDPQILVALCLGTMTIEVFFWTGSTTAVESLPLGLDPTPDQIRRGRDVFLDGQRSSDARFTCATCHPRGQTDQLGWMLRGHPCDEKDVMVTQSLLSIADTFPHHWRGERDLDDFRKAFPDLLGDPTLPAMTDPASDATVADFVAFVQSLQAPANPLQSPRRRLDDEFTAEPAPNGMLGSAVNGQRAFQDVPNFNDRTCAQCHLLESGGSGAFLEEVGSLAPRTAPIESAHFRQLQHKGQATTTLAIGSGQPFTVNADGFGFLHNGDSPSLFTFIFNTSVFQTLTDQERVDVFQFVRQFDQGLSPATHWAAWLDSASGPSVPIGVERILIDGADHGWNDVVAFGRIDVGAGLVPARFWYDAAALPEPLFRPEGPGLPELTWSGLKTAAAAGRAEVVLLGLPPTNGRRFGIDHDNDGLANGAEVARGLDPWTPDTDGDGWWDGHEVENDDDPLLPQIVSSDDTPPGLAAPAVLDFTSSRMAKYHVTFTEDAKYVVAYSIPGSPRSYSFQRDYFSRSDTFVLTHDEPASPQFPPNYTPPIPVFQAEITLTDRKGNASGPFPLVPFEPKEAELMNLGVFSAPQAHVAQMEWLRQDRVGSTLDAEVRISLDLNFFENSSASSIPDFIPAANTMIFATLCVEDMASGDFAKSTTFTTPHPTGFSIFDAGGNVSTYTVDPGPPWIVSPLTDAQGKTVIQFQQPSLAPGQRVRLVVMGTASQPNDTGEFSAVTLFQLQPLFREDAGELKLTF
jgi:hypothetical protein